jgi:hypothetical protein
MGPDPSGPVRRSVVAGEVDRPGVVVRVGLHRVRPGVAHRAWAPDTDTGQRRALVPVPAFPARPGQQVSVKFAVLDRTLPAVVSYLAGRRRRRRTITTGRPSTRTRHALTLPAQRVSPGRVVTLTNCSHELHACYLTWLVLTVGSDSPAPAGPDRARFAPMFAKKTGPTVRRVCRGMITRRRTVGPNAGAEVCRFPPI